MDCPCVQALFRPITVVVPDRQLIMENSEWRGGAHGVGLLAAGANAAAYNACMACTCRP